MSDIENSEEWLMTQVRRGKQDYFEPLVRRTATPLLNFLFRMTGDLDKSEELFQEVYLAVWTRRRQYRFPMRFRSWLFAIGLNRVRAAYRRRRLPIVSSDTGGTNLADANKDPCEAASAAETAALVSQAVRRLPPPQRAVVVLRIWHQLPYARIAEIVGRPEGTVRSQMHHGLAALRRFLSPRLSQQPEGG